MTAKTTDIMYQADWLVWGGPPPAKHTQIQSLLEDIASTMLSVIRTESTWQVVAGDGEVSNRFVVMESNDVNDVTNYFFDYMREFENWERTDGAGA